jgi:hypothetical protein
MTLFAHLKRRVMPMLDRVVRRSSDTYRMMQREQTASVERKSARDRDRSSAVVQRVLGTQKGRGG